MNHGITEEKVEMKEKSPSTPKGHIMIYLTVDTRSQTGDSEVVATAAVNNSNIDVKGGEADGEGKIMGGVAAGEGAAKAGGGACTCASG